MEERHQSPAQSALRWRRVVVGLLLVGLAAGLLSVRPWDAPRYDCAVTVRPGESIQAAIDAAEVGAVICLARGEWAESIVIEKSLTLVGRGVGRTIIDVGLAVQPVVGVSGRGAESVDVELKGVTITGGGLGSGVEISGRASVAIRDCHISGRAYGVVISDSASLTLAGCTISNSPQRGVFLTDSARALITGSRIVGNRRFGIWVDGSAHAALLDSEVSANGSHGLWLRDGAQVEFADCSVSDNLGHGIWLTGQSAAQLLRGQVSGNSERGIMAEGSTSVELADSSVLSNWHGIEVASVARASVTGSTVSGSRFDGVRVRDYAHATISACVISSNRRGVWLGGEAKADISDCLVEDNAGYGVFSWYRADSSGGGNLFRGNGVDLGGNLSWELRLPLTEPTESEISWPDDRYDSLQEAVDALVAGGKLLLEPGEYTAGLTIGKELVIDGGEGQVALRAKTDVLPVLSLVDGADLHLLGATITGGAEGLLISGTARAVLVGCTVAQNADGINLSHSPSLEVVGCRITGNERYGIFAGGVAQVTVVGCDISSNHESGFAATDFAQATIMDSMVTNNGPAGGILLWGSCQATLEGNTISENHGFGVAIHGVPCFHQRPWLFRGRISGGANVFEANRRADVCPPELEFLSTADGGEWDQRP